MATDDAPDRPRKRVAKTTHDQLGVPRTPRGTLPDGGHLSPLEKLLMIALGLFGMGRATYAELADAIGLQGSRKKLTDQIHKLLFGRKVGGRHRPGLVQRGWVLIRFENVPGYPNQRIIERTAQWTEYLGRGPESLPAPDPGSSSAAGPARDPAPGGSAPANPRVQDLATQEDALRRDLRAHELIDRWRKRGVLFVLGPDGMIRLKQHPGMVDVSLPNAEEMEELKRSKPEIVAFLRLGQAPAESPRQTGPREVPSRPSASPSPPVEKPGEIRATIGQLRGCPDDSLSSELAGRLAGPAGFRDKDHATSSRTYYGLFEAVRRGELSEDCIQQAFEAATGRKCRNRGAMFISRVKVHISRQLAMKNGP